ncbi:hypothetical protein [Streptomyces sp. NPDC088358]|uniref:hypothetical protein n=1 Tax=Streptomyces sp. NPDC088358 TaxID=3365857 RepID=UPI00381D6483
MKWFTGEDQRSASSTRPSSDASGGHRPSPFRDPASWKSVALIDWAVVTTETEQQAQAADEEFVVRQRPAVHGEHQQMAYQVVRRPCPDRRGGRVNAAAASHTPPSRVGSTVSRRKELIEHSWCGADAGSARPPEPAASKPAS